MAFPQSSRAYADASYPEPWGVCDRCGFRYLRSQLVWQWDWRGPSLANLRILVCTATCDDIPQEQLRPIILGPDPIAVSDPRPGFAASQQGYTPTFGLLELVDGDILPPPVSHTSIADNTGNPLLDNSGNWLWGRL